MRKDDGTAMKIQVRGTIVEILAYSAAYLNTAFRRHGHIPDIEKPVKIRSEQ
jgi:hypothetical protein